MPEQFPAYWLRIEESRESPQIYRVFTLIAPYGRVHPRDMCDTERCGRGCGSQLPAPSAWKGAWDGAGGKLGVLGTRAWATAWGEKGLVLLGLLLREDKGTSSGCACPCVRAVTTAITLVPASPQLPGAPRAQAAPTVPTHLWVTTMGFGTMSGEAPETLLSITSPVPGSLSSPHLPRGHFKPAPDTISSLSIKKAVLT